MLGGVQFTEKSHNHVRLDSVPRVSGAKTYHLRIDGSALEIKRHGATTKEYNWTVKDKEGTVKYFTGFDGHSTSVSVDTEASEHNQVEWLLTKVEDRHGNRIVYEYGNSGGVAYVSSIEYSAFKIEFVRSKNERTDAVVNCRLGLVQTDNQLLDSVKVFVSGKPLRSYTFEYSDGEFGKKCLKSVVENDSKGDRFYSHRFDYYNDIADGLFSDRVETWKSKGTPYKSGGIFTSSVDGYSDEMSMINGSYSGGYSVGGGAHVGVGFGHVNVYAGASYQYSENESDGKSTLTDINGDGLPDLVFVKDGKLMFLPGLDSITDNGHRFGLEMEIKNAPEPTITKGKSQTHNLLLDAGAQFFFISGNACYSHNWQKSETMIYLQDFNADGLVDIAYKGKVYFNHIEDGTPVFTTLSQPTPCPIPGLDIHIDSAFVMSEKQIEHLKDSASRMFPRHDVIRVWRAPYSGKITIGQDNVHLPSSVDGVNVIIQHNSKELVRKTVNKGENIKVGDSFAVKEGDRVYFRIQSGFDANADSAIWNPTVKYKSVYTKIESGENGSLMKYAASGQFLFCGVPDVPLQKQCAIRIEAPFSKGELTDDICLVVRKSALKIEGSDTTVVSTDIERRYLRAGEVYEKEPMNIYMSVDQKDIDNNSYLSFIVECSSQILWERIKWHPVVTVVGETEPFIYVAPKYTMYNRHFKVAPSVNTGVSGLTGISADFKGEPLRKSDSDDLKVNFSIKAENGTALYSGPYSEGMSIQIDLTGVEKVYGSFYLNHELESVETAKFTINGKACEASVYCAYNDESMGHLYSGWGQFAYNGEGKERADNPINEDELYFDIAKYDEVINSIDKDAKPEQIDTTTVKADKLAEIPTVNDQKFFIMTFVPKSDRYESIAKDSYVSATSISPSRIGSQSIGVDLPDYPKPFNPEDPENEATACPIQKISGEGDSFSGSGSAIVSAGGGWGKTESFSNVSLADVNGDGYPDWINGDNNGVSVQYTQSDGRLTTRVESFSVVPSHNTSTSKNANVGVSFSGTTPDVVAEIGKRSNWSSMGIQKAAGSNNSSSASISVSGNFANNESKSNGEWVDINGDGLPDFVSSSGSVRYNIGGVLFDDEERSVGTSSAYVEQTKTEGAGLGVNVSIRGKASAGGGLSTTNSRMEMKELWRDMNGDGLADFIYNDNGKMTIWFNSGTGLLSKARDESAKAGASSSVSQSVSCNVAGTIPIVFVQLTPSVSYSNSQGVCSTTNSIMDINGDGYPDIVESTGHDNMRVRLSNIRRTNRLKSVTLPLGGKIELDYTMAKHSYRNPNARWVMSKIEVKGGSPELGATSTKDTITYIGGNYNRCERTFLGFDTVRVSQLDTEHGDSIYRTISTAYLTNSFYSKHQPSEVRTEDREGKVLTSVRYEYELRGDSAYGGIGVFPALIKETTTQYGDDAELSKVRTFDYDSLCNIVKYSVDGDLNAEMEYHKSDIVRNVVKSLKVGDLRERRSEIDERGNVTQMTVVTGSESAVYDMEYDSYGNLTKITRPANENGERAWTKVRYEDLLHTLPVEVSDSYGLHSQTEYDPLFCVPLKTTDSNGADVLYTYDQAGRLTMVLAPKDAEASRPYTLQFEYDLSDKDGTYKGVTTHFTQDGKLIVTSYIDSLGRAKYTERASMLSTANGIEKKTVRSAYTMFDAFGRKVREIKPSVVGEKAETAITTEYDILDRLVTTTLPDKSEIRYTYTVEENETAGATVLRATVTDAIGGVTDRMTDGRGRTVATVRHHKKEDGGEQLITVLNQYDAMNQLIKVIHPNKSESSYEYDKAGGVITYTSPDAGTVKTEYTPQGQVRRRTVATGSVTEYSYDGERLVTISYPDAPQDSVIYTYGDSTATDLSRGRLVSVRDASGTESYTYGIMGEVTETERVMNIDAESGATHRFKYGAEYDSWGRIRRMTYPDGEEVTYNYYGGTGELHSVTGHNSQGGKEIYLEKAGYDTHGRTAYRRMGNGTEHCYTYDDNEHLQSARLTDGFSETLSSNTYGYDAAGNITRIKGVSESSYYQKYVYDDLSRLTGASGMSTEHKADGGEEFSTYSMRMDYNIMSAPELYDLTITSTSGSKSIENAYLYGEVQPDAPVRVGDTGCKYDASGNPVSMRGGEVDRTLRYDAENRLRVIEDTHSSIMSLYTYNHTGERSLKRYGTFNRAHVNGAYAGSVLDGLTRYSAYVSPYYVEHGTGSNAGTATKHYYIGTERLVSKLVTESGGKEDVKDEDTYYYFTDHLGSTTHITDKGGKVVQYAAYTPYGTLFREYKSVMPYKFNGKELDQETGYYYYGARYYDPGLALWLGVDPLAEKYPDVSPYVYCAANPVKYVDPDGREKLIFLAPGESNNRISNAANNYPENDGVIHIWAHGVSDEIDKNVGLQYYSNIDGCVTLNNSLQFEQFIQQSETYQKNEDNNKLSIIVLHSCKTGQKDGFAENISKDINAIVVAPSDNVNVETTLPAGKSVEKGVANRGSWNIYYKGKLVNSFDGNTKPIFSNPDNIINKYAKNEEESK